jgi:hypothetical protein
VTQDETLDDWFRKRLKMRVPNLAVCEHHDPPFQMFADAFFERAPQIIGLACRNGGKSIGVAGLNLAEMSLKPNCGIVSLAGNLAQAKRGHDHVKNMLRRDPGLSSKLAGNPLSTKTEFVNGSSLEILPASERSVHSPHVPKLRIDEVDLVAPEIYQGALSIPITTGMVRSGIVMTSTRFKAYGMMYHVVEESQGKDNVIVRQWCVREVVKRCPYRYDQCPMKACEGFCDGKWCKKATGFYEIDDVYAKYLTMDQETWETQWLVEKPSRQGLVYDTFGPHHVVKEEDLPPYLRIEEFRHKDQTVLDPRIRPAWNQRFEWFAGVDWGYEDPLVVLLMARTPNDDIYVIDEMYIRHQAPSEAARRVVDRFPMLVVRLNDETYSEHEIAPVFCDPSDPAAVREFQMSNLVTMARAYQIQEGVSLIRRFLKPPGQDAPKLFVHERCVQLRGELNRYHIKENTDKPADEDNHGPDALRYAIQGTFVPRPEVISSTLKWEPPQTPISPDLDIQIPGLGDL